MKLGGLFVYAGGHDTCQTPRRRKRKWYGGANDGIHTLS